MLAETCHTNCVFDLHQWSMSHRCFFGRKRNRDRSFLVEPAETLLYVDCGVLWSAIDQTVIRCDLASGQTSYANTIAEVLISVSDFSLSAMMFRLASASELYDIDMLSEYGGPCANSR